MGILDQEADQRLELISKDIEGTRQMFLAGKIGRGMLLDRLERYTTALINLTRDLRD